MWSSYNLLIVEHVSPFDDAWLRISRNEFQKWHITIVFSVDIEQRIDKHIIGTSNITQYAFIGKTELTLS